VVGAIRSAATWAIPPAARTWKQTFMPAGSG
jgi:hypothetical protein